MMIQSPITVTKVLSASLALGTFLAMSPGLLAGETYVSDGKMSKPIVEMETPAPKSRWSGDLGLTVVSQYISRGLIFENQGGIFQPYVDLYLNVYEGEGFLKSVTLNLGLWSSLQSRKTDAGAVGGGSSSLSNWYEFDYTLGVSIGLAGGFTLTPSYFEFDSPNDGFDPVRALNVKLAWDDSALWGGKFALNPYVTYFHEYEGKAGNGPDQGNYYEVGISPGVDLGPVGVSFPVAAGFGSDDFYEGNESFGYVSGGVAVSYELSFIPSDWGTYTITGGATYYYLGSALDQFNENNVRDAGHEEYVFSGGVSVAF